jgi:hypothetical protein
MGKKYIHIYFGVGVVVSVMPLIRISEKTGQVSNQHIRQTGQVLYQYIRQTGQVLYQHIRQTVLPF